MRVIVDGRQISSGADLHLLLADSLDFGPHYGNNLAALWDRLSTDVERPVELIWTHWEESKMNLGDDLFEEICRILNRAQAQDMAFKLHARFTFELRSTHTHPA
ncbi:barstar family protein [Streptosporangium sandarakinum]|uniref:barstar family protein n=1 Tax=Streptosporangium sandarakinum TaxID=1260955 RepID=UPI0033B9F86A